MNYKNQMESISFLSETEKKELIELFISANTSFFMDYKDLVSKNEIDKLKKLCHNFGSSITVFNLDECSVLLQEIMSELNSNNLEKANSLCITIENNLNHFIAFLKK